MREKWDSLSLCDKTETVSLSSEHRYQKYIIGMWLEHKEEKQKKSWTKIMEYTKLNSTMIKWVS